MTEAHEVERVIARWVAAVEREDEGALKALRAQGYLSLGGATNARSHGSHGLRGAPTLIDLNTTVSADVAFATCRVLTDGGGATDTWDLTLCLEKQEATWRVVHEHRSRPSLDAQEEEQPRRLRLTMPGCR